MALEHNDTTIIINLCIASSPSLKTVYYGITVNSRNHTLLTKSANKPKTMTFFKKLQHLNSFFFPALLHVILKSLVFLILSLLLSCLRLKIVW